MEGHTSGNSAPSSGETAGLTTKVLASRAAAAALSGPAVSPGQWVYRNYAVVATPDNAASPITTERWATADNTTAFITPTHPTPIKPQVYPRLFAFKTRRSRVFVGARLQAIPWSCACRSRTGDGVVRAKTEVHEPALTSIQIRACHTHLLRDASIGGGRCSVAAANLLTAATEHRPPPINAYGKRA